MSRIQRFNELQLCPIRGKWFKKLNQEGFDFCVQFIKQNELDSKADFEFKANRLFLDQPIKPKNYNVIWALLVEVA